MYTYKRFKTSKSAVTIILIGLSLFIWGSLGLAGSVLAEKGGKKIVYVDVTFRDGSDDRVRSDGNGPYKNGKDNVLAGVYKRFRLDTTRGASSHKGGKRTVTMNFSHALTADVQSIFGTDDVSVAADMRLCYKWYDDTDVLEEFPNVSEMPVGSESKVTMSIHFSYNEVSYGLAFGNLYQFTGEVYQGTDPVIVRREETDRWTIEAPPGAKAGLCLMDWKNGDPHYENIEMPFMITLEAQQPKGGKKAPPASNLSSELTSTWGRIKADLQ